ncbi:uncharacterized protein LOC121373607 [Gigantopelta aegis]|uniref:uncharacterized protein LOC121373607 n=1 Tax=Gigantopelta aegis TaxID=1735272 RepID=UPI001B8886DD|nr:uncharacterized protein LOC121373607 [Gigantopelta aegis]XP_041356236.1 uncharacterized protein LOC121373607 [Gigantopelta aegis]
MMSCVRLLLVLCLLCKDVVVDADVRLLSPPQRSSMWRYGHAVPENKNDGKLNCGGFEKQWNGTFCCRLCGDPCDGDLENEAPGKYVTNIIPETYDQASVISVTVELFPTQQLGYMEFRLCALQNVDDQVTQTCLDQNLLSIVETNGMSKFYPGSHSGNFSLSLQLPKSVTCEHCVLQMKYVAGNRPPEEGSSCQCLGCGKQEHFFNCADIKIITPTNSSTPVTNEPSTTQSSANGGSSTSGGSTTDSSPDTATTTPASVSTQSTNGSSTSAGAGTTATSGTTADTSSANTGAGGNNTGGTTVGPAVGTGVTGNTSTGATANVGPDGGSTGGNTSTGNTATGSIGSGNSTGSGSSIGTGNDGNKPGDDLVGTEAPCTPKSKDYQCASRVSYISDRWCLQNCLLGNCNQMMCYCYCMDMSVGQAAPPPPPPLSKSCKAAADPIYDVWCETNYVNHWCPSMFCRIVVNSLNAISGN